MIERALIDTSVIIQPPTGGLASVTAGATVSLISVAELQYGLAVADDVEELTRRRRRLYEVLDDFEIVNPDVATTDVYRQLVRLVVLAGRLPRSRRYDLLIAASAARHDIPILTRNPDDLRGLDRAITVVSVA